MLSATQGRHSRMMLMQPMINLMMAGRWRWLNDSNSKG